MATDFLAKLPWRGPEELTDPMGAEMSCTLTRCIGRFPCTFWPLCFLLRRQQNSPTNNKAITTTTGTTIAAASSPVERPWREEEAEGVATGAAVVVPAAGPPGKVGGPDVEVAGWKGLEMFAKELGNVVLSAAEGGRLVVMSVNGKSEDVAKLPSSLFDTPVGTGPSAWVVETV